MGWERCMVGGFDYRPIRVRETTEMAPVEGCDW